MADKYAAVDAAILQRIGTEGCTPFPYIDAREVRDAIRAMGIVQDQFRVTDRRLQALRKAGVIEFVRGPCPGWRRAKATSGTQADGEGQ
jgi:hypothetical protein